MAESRDSNITNNAGGVMTDEVGVITGDLTLRSELVVVPAAGPPTPAAVPAASPTRPPVGATAPATPATRPTAQATGPTGAQATGPTGAPATGPTGAQAGRPTAAPAGGTVRLRVQYQGAAEWYTVTNGSCQITDVKALDAVHQLAVGLLDRPEG